MKEMDIDANISRLIREIRGMYLRSADSTRMPVDDWMRVRGVLAIAERREVETLSELSQAMSALNYERFFAIANRPALPGSAVIENNATRKKAAQLPAENRTNIDLPDIASQCDAARAQFEKIRAAAREQVIAQFQRDIIALPGLDEANHRECPRVLRKRIEKFIQNENDSLAGSDEATLRNIEAAMHYEREDMTSIATTYLNAIKTQITQYSENSKTDTQQTTSNIDEALSTLHEMYEAIIEYISPENVQHAQAMHDDAVRRLKEDESKQEEITDKFFADLQLCRAGVLSRNGDSAQGELNLGNMRTQENDDESEWEFDNSEQGELNLEQMDTQENDEASAWDLSKSEQGELHLGAVDNFAQVLGLLGMGTLAAIIKSDLQ